MAKALVNRASAAYGGVRGGTFIKSKASCKEIFVSRLQPVTL
jgi:hypothetical protein